MDDIIQSYDKLKTLTENFGSDYDKNQPYAQNPFYMIQHNVIVVLELLSHYKREWTSVDTSGYTQDKIEESKRENGERIILLECMCFIESVSDIEFVAKQILENGSASQLQTIKNNLANERRIYLRKIMKQSHGIGVINQQDWEDWQNLIILRNHFIHNNSTAEENSTVTINGITIQYVEGEQLRGNLLFIPKLNEYLISLFKKWTDNF